MINSALPLEPFSYIHIAYLNIYFEVFIHFILLFSNIPLCFATILYFIPIRNLITFRLKNDWLKVFHDDQKGRDLWAQVGT